MYFFKSLPRLATALLLTTSTSVAAQTMDELLTELEACSPELISRAAAVGVASGEVEAEKAKRLPSFSLSANGSLQADSSSDSNLNASARYTLLSFGKFETNDAFAEQKLAVEALSARQKGHQTLTQLLKSKSEFLRLTADIDTLESVVEMQRKVLDRVERRAKVALSSESDKNAVFSKVWQNQNRVNENRLQQQRVKNEIDLLACTDSLKALSLSDIAIEKTDVPVLTQEFVNLDVSLLDARIESKLLELEANRKSLRPDLDLVGNIPVDGNADKNSSLGLEMNVSYGNMGRVEAARAVSLEKEVSALVMQREVSNSQRIRSLVSIEQRIMVLRNDVIPNQQLSIDSIALKLSSKERLFKAGRVSLFELLSAFDELLTARIALNKFIAELEQAEIERASALDFVYR